MKISNLPDANKLKFVLTCSGNKCKKYIYILMLLPSLSIPSCSKDTIMTILVPNCH